MVFFIQSELRLLSGYYVMKKILRALSGETFTSPPIWMMRQAGRYLPEYREIRKQAGSFLDLCYSPELAAEVTLQPIRRFGFDAAILFADILLIPDGLGQNVAFEEGRGPVLEPLEVGKNLKGLSLDGCLEHLAPVFETVERVKKDLPDEVALIGFCGAPWTVATYMIAGHGTSDQKPARLAAYQDPVWFQAVIDLLNESSIDYLNAQIAAGCEAVQIFDSWSGVLPEAEFLQWCVAPLKKIISGVRAQHPNIPIIGFPRGAGLFYESFVENTKVDAVSIDTAMSLPWVRTHLQNRVTVQGNLDPLLVVQGGDRLEYQVKYILSELGSGPLVFNLGHGLVPETPVENVARIIELVRSNNVES